MRSFVLSRARAANYPGVLYEIVQNIGEEATAKLIEQYGGLSSLYIPVRITPDHALVRLLGQEAAQCMAAEYGGLTVEIPRAVVLQRIARNAAILQDHAAGMTQSELARKYHLTTRGIRNIVPKKTA